MGLLLLLSSSSWRRESLEMSMESMLEGKEVARSERQGRLGRVREDA